jgi:hypothetical protein
MDCNNAKELLSVYIFEEIESGDRQRLDSHLQVCGACTRNLENFRVVREALQELPDPDVPGDFLVGVRSRLEQPVTFMDQVDEALASLSGRRMAAGASVALAAGFAFLVGNTSGDLTTPPMRAQALRQESDALAPAAPVSSKGFADRVDELEADADEAPSGKVATDEEGATRESAEGRKELASAAAPVAGSGPVARLAEVAPEPARASRPGAAESFDDVFGDPEPEERAVAAPPAEDLVRTELAALPRASAQPPSSPFLERQALRAKADKKKVETSARDLSSMGANELGEELARLEKSKRRIRSRAAPQADLSIFSPTAGESLGGAPEAIAPASPVVADAEDYAVDGFGGGTAMARVSDGDPFDSMAGVGPGRGDLFADAPQVPPVTIAFLRTTFGRSVHVLEPTQVSRFPAQVGRDLGLRSQDPRSALKGIHSLIESGLGLELQGVEMRQGEEVTLLISLASGNAGAQALDRFVEDLRGLAGTALASDVASVSRGELGRLARVSIPTP